MSKGWKSFLRAAAVLIFILEMVLWISLPYRFGVCGSIVYFVSTITSSPLQSFLFFDLVVAYIFLSAWLYPQCRKRGQNVLLWMFLLWTVGAPSLMYYLSAYSPEAEG